MKPDYLAFGGCIKNPFQLFGLNGSRAFSCGTSFSTPYASRLHGMVRGIFQQGSSLLARVLMAHCAKHPTATHCRDYGWGILPDDWGDLLYTNDGSVTIVFQGIFLPGKYHVLPIPIFDKINLPGTVNFRWTIGALSPVNVNHPGDYTTCCIEDTFYPDSRNHRYTYKVDGITRKPKTLHDIQDATEIEKLLKEGWKKSFLPVTKSPKKSEQALRATDFKWDTIVKRQASRYGSLLNNPYLVLHSMERRENVSRFDYAVALTISSPKYTGDLFTDVINHYPILQPIQIRSEADIIIPISG